MLEAATAELVREDTTLAELDRDLDAFSEGTEALPVLSPEALSRASMYEDHD
jgi:hypothetical protein